jgi:hypothetical protein
VVVRARRGAQGSRKAVLLFLPAGSGRDGHLPLRVPEPAQDAGDRRPPALRAQARNGNRQDRRDGAHRHLGDAAQAQGERLVALSELPGVGSEPDGPRQGERSAARRRPRSGWRAQSLRRLRHGAPRVPRGVPPQRARAQLAGHSAREQARGLDRRRRSRARGGAFYPAGGAARDAAPRPAGSERADPATARRLARPRGDQRRGAPRLRREARQEGRGARVHQMEQDPRAHRQGGAGELGDRSLGHALVRLRLAQAGGHALRVAGLRLLGLRRIRVRTGQGRAPAGPGRTRTRLPGPVGPGEGSENQGGIPALLQGRDREHLLVVEEGLRRVVKFVRVCARTGAGAPLRGRQRAARGLALRAPDARVRVASQPR